MVKTPEQMVIRLPFLLKPHTLKQQRRLKLLAALIQLLIFIFSILILARVLMSWIQINPYSPLAQMIFNLTEPILAPVRNLLPPASGLDFSPLIVLIGIQVLGSILIQIFS